jgi:hypothetical protein
VETRGWEIFFVAGLISVFDVPETQNIVIVNNSNPKVKYECKTQIPVWCGAP